MAFPLQSLAIYSCLLSSILKQNGAPDASGEWIDAV
jgi:hypothetical protein